MSLQAIQAIPHPNGNRIDVQWQFAPNTVYDGVRVVRKTGTYPQHPEDGYALLSTDFEPQTAVTDTDLQANQIYYYTLFPFTGNPPNYQFDRRHRVSSLATGRHGSGEYMWKRVPAIYHRYDIKSGLLQRFIELVGGQLDQQESFTRFGLQLKNIEKTPGGLLPLLAQWIAWKTDFRREPDSQRMEIRNAPAIYKTVGILPTVEATIKRISGLESRSKEFVHNVFASNRPERLNLWSLWRDETGAWSESEMLQSLDYVFDGRPASVFDDQNVHWLFYHTRRRNHWEIWFKTSPAYTLSLQLQDQIQTGAISLQLFAALTLEGVPVTQTATLNNISGNRWEIVDGAERFVVELLQDKIKFYHLTAPSTELGASEPVVGNKTISKYPSAAQQGDTLWLFWTQFDEAQQRWQIYFRTRTDARWSVIGPQADIAQNPFAEAGIYNATIARREPCTVTDDSGRLWLFWQEQYAGRWRLRYNRREGGLWAQPQTMPLDAGADPNVTRDLMVLIPPSIPNQRIYVFWARKVAPSTAAQESWQIAYRVKEDLTFDENNWSAVNTLPKAASSDNHHDRGAFAIFSAGTVEVFWSSNREDSGWAIWRGTLSDHVANTWDDIERITPEHYSQHAPLAIHSDQQVWLLYRSNRNMVYKSDVYRATETDDQRYAGATTLDVRHQQRWSLHRQFEDSNRYTYDTGTNGVRTDNDWIARDTIGAYLETDTFAIAEIENTIARLRPVVREFLPMTDRAVFVSSSSINTEYVYGYSLPPTENSYYITSSYSDEFTSTDNSSALQPGEDFSAILET